MAKNKLTAIIPLIVLLIAVTGYMLISKPSQPNAEDKIVAPKAVEQASNNIALAQADVQADTKPADSEEVEATSTGFDLEKAMSVRSLGNDDAPIVIEEFASLSCGHCAAFYKSVFPELKEKFIDTGKVKFVYTDFPLNAPAMDASMVSRCLPHERYFKYIKFLFDTQDDWAFEAGYQQKLKQNAKLLGGDEETLTACLANDELKQALAKRMQDAAAKHEVNSTPSFIITGPAGTEKIKGQSSLAAFEKAINRISKESSATE